MNQTRVYSLQDIPDIAQNLKKQLADCAILSITGPLGAGKTTLIKALLQAWGVKERVTSPTFTYMQPYESETGKQFYHFDLYRLGSLHEFMQAGFHEYLFQPQSLSIIEWSEIIKPLLSEGVCHITLDYHEDPTRRIMHIKKD